MQRERKTKMTEVADDKVMPGDVLHFAEGMLYSLYRLIERCPVKGFKSSMRNIGITELARNINYWKMQLKEKEENEKEEKNV